VPKTQRATEKAKRPHPKKGGRAEPGERRGKPEPKPQEPEREAPRARAFWSGTLSFGLVSIPVDLHPATRSAGVSLRMLGPDGTPLSRRYFCPEHDFEVPDEELARGYEHEPGSHVLVDDAELEALAPEKSRDIDLRRFVRADSIDPLYFDRAYVLAPNGDSNKAYRLLVAVMGREHVAGIATFVLRDQQHVIAIFADGGMLRGQTLRFVDELRPHSGIGAPAAKTADADALREWRAELKRQGTRPFDPKSLRDDSADRLRALAEDKRERQQDVFVRAERDEVESVGAEMIDLLDVLKRSLSTRQRDQAP
jgi:DNA end-binding protein Ku